MRREKLSRKGPIWTTAVWAIFTAGIAFWNYIFLVEPGGPGRRTILAAAICGVWAGVGAWCIAISWPERRPKATEKFIHAWAATVPTNQDFEVRRRYVYDLLVAAGADPGENERTRQR